MSPLLRKGWMREIISRPVWLEAKQRSSQPRCIGNFTDPVTHKPVRIDMGEVWLRVPMSFRAAPSVGFPSAFEGKKGAAQSGEKSAGTYVTPVQMLTG